MPRFAKKLNSPVVHDVIFALTGVGSVLFLALASGHGAPAIAATEPPLRAGATLLGLLAAAVTMAAATMRGERGNRDEYVNQTLARSALIGMVALVLSASFWEALFADNVGPLHGLTVVAMALGAWSLGYLYTRITGTVR
ncbi:MAG TPA: hypothetical protein VEB68_05755 [Croceibacterium sp.]|nr:hypothetical protein [Croceibacterium sp.]